jgi:hypothetical protein
MLPPTCPTQRRTQLLVKKCWALPQVDLNLIQATLRAEEYVNRSALLTSVGRHKSNKSFHKQVARERD